MIKSITITNHKDEALLLELSNPYDTGIVITDVTGIGPNKADINTSSLAISDGSVFNSAVVSSRNIVFSFQLIEDPTTVKVEDSRHRVYKYFPLKEKVLVSIETDNHTVNIYGYVESVEPNIFQEKETVQVSIICVKPWFFGSTSSIILNANEASEYLDDIIYEIESKTLDFVVHEETSGDIEYLGDVNTGVIARFTLTNGSVSKPSLTNQLTNETMSLDTHKIGLLMGGEQQLPAPVTLDGQTYYYENELYVVTEFQNIYKYNSGSWEYWDSLPMAYEDAEFAVMDHYMFVLGTKNQESSIFVYDLLDRPFSPYASDAIISSFVFRKGEYDFCMYDGKIHIVSTSGHWRINNNTSIQKINDDIDLGILHMQCVSHDNKLHMFGNYDRDVRITETELLLPSRVETTSYVTPLAGHSNHNDLYRTIVLNGKIHLLGGPYGKMYVYEDGRWEDKGSLPNSGDASSIGICCNCCVFNNEIHLITSSGYTRYNYHYRWNGLSWSLMDTIDVPYLMDYWDDVPFGDTPGTYYQDAFPYGFDTCLCIEYKNCLHVWTQLKGPDNKAWSPHLIYHGGTWVAGYNSVKERRLFHQDHIYYYQPTNAMSLRIHTYDDYVYFFYGNTIRTYYDTGTYGSDGYVGTITEKFISAPWGDDSNYATNGTPIYFSNHGENIYAIMCSDVDSQQNNYKLYQFMGSGWSQSLIDASTISLSGAGKFYFKSLVSYDGKLMVLDVNAWKNDKNDKFHASWNSTSNKWVDEGEGPYDVSSGGYSVVEYAGEMHVLGGVNTPREHQKFDGEEWSYESTLPYDFANGSAVSHDGKLLIIGSTDNPYYNYNWDGSKWQVNRNNNMQPGDVIEISTVPGNKYVKGIRGTNEYNVISAMSRDSDWLHIETGINTIIYNAEEGIYNMIVEVTYTDYYKGV